VSEPSWEQADPTFPYLEEETVSNPVDHPEHYGGDTTYEAIRVIEAWDLGFHLGNCVKYVARAGRKGDELEDLRKARWYLDRYIRLAETAAASKVVTAEAVLAAEDEQAWEPGRHPFV